MPGQSVWKGMSNFTRHGGATNIVAGNESASVQVY